MSLLINKPKYNVGDLVILNEDGLRVLNKSHEGFDGFVGKVFKIKEIDYFKSDSDGEYLYTGYMVDDNSRKAVAMYESEIKYLYSNISLPKDEIDSSQKGEDNNFYEQKGKELGALVDKKQSAYGNAIQQTYDAVKVFMKPYLNDNGTYTIPESLLMHLLLQVRIIDKQNRIFNNPDHDLMDESPYRDIGGYGLLGDEMSKKAG